MHVLFWEVMIVILDDYICIQEGAWVILKISCQGEWRVVKGLDPNFQVNSMPSLAVKNAYAGPLSVNIKIYQVLKTLKNDAVWRSGSYQELQDLT